MFKFISNLFVANNKEEIIEEDEFPFQGEEEQEKTESKNIGFPKKFAKNMAKLYEFQKLGTNQMARNEQFKKVISNPSMSLSIWKDFIESLIRKYGPDAEMSTEVGDDDVEVQLILKIEPIPPE